MLLLLLSCWIIVGIAAEVAPVMYYRAKNSSCCLQLTTQANFDIRWKFKGKQVVFNKAVTPEFQNKVNYDEFSLCINNLSEADSGIYSAEITDTQYNIKTKTHKLIVEETVPRPVIRMSGMPSNLNTGSCNVTGNCSVLSDWLRFVCDEDGCSTTESSLSKVNISVSADNRSVVCRGSNHVSSSNVSASRDVVCFMKPNPDQEETPQSFTVIIIISAVLSAVFVFLVVVLICLGKRHFSAKHNHREAQTAPAQKIHGKADEPEPQPAARASTSSCSDAEVSYENVDAIHNNSAAAPCPDSYTTNTLYCSVMPPRSDGVAGVQPTVQDLSRPLAQDEEQQPIDTVYSVLQNPQSMR